MTAETDLLIDRFVTKLNGSGFPSELCSNVPEGLRSRLTVPDSVDPDFCNWKITPVANAPWVSGLEARLPAPLPPLFLSLLRRYIFLLFESGPLSFFANTGHEIYDEFSIAIFRDKAISEKTLAAGFIHFARLDTGDYDPICFDTNSSGKNGDYRIVQIDHEEILINGRVVVVKEIAGSFRQFVRDYLGDADSS